MTTVAKKSVLDMMDEAIQESATKATGGFKPTFLTLKDKQKAILRPLFNVDQAIPLMMHNKFCKADPKQSINAVCAQEIGKPCTLCELAVSDKQLRSSLSLMLPVHIYRIGIKQDNGSWAELTYKNAEGSDIRVEGLRIVELKQYGAITSVYQTLRTYYRDYPSHDIRECDFSIERVGAMQTTSYITLPRAPKPASQEIMATIPTGEAVRDMLLAACKPHIPEASLNGSLNGTSDAHAHEDDDAPDF